MEFAVEPLVQIRPEWLHLTEACPEATLYQRDRWLTALGAAYGFKFRAATLRDSNGRLAAACLFARGKNPFVHKWTSLPCSDSSPPIAYHEEARERLLDGILHSSLAAEGVAEIRGWDASEPWQQANCFADWRIEL